MREVRNFVGGRWEERDGLKTEPVYDPATGEVIAETPLSTYEDVDRAVKTAQAAFPEWSARCSRSCASKTSTRP
jgi:malonate-semialdehyde dehydrogenase (acetylating)/methylmalonate-semialdehyde dehydrogenase